MPVLTYPVPVADFWRGLKILSFDMRLGGGLQSQATGGGEVITARTGQRLWEGEVSLVMQDDPGATEAVLQALREPGRSFMCEAHKRLFPLADAAGAQLGAATPVIASLPVGGRSMTLSGLPAGYVLSPGDFLALTRGTPTRYELLQIVTGAVASGGGVSGEFEVTPGIRPGIIVGAAVVLARPQFRAMIVPDSLKFSGTSPGRAPRAGASFAFRQTLARS